MKGISHFITILFSLSSIGVSYAFINKNSSIILQTPPETSITATISKDTTEKQFEELISYFKEKEIIVNINQVRYNDAKEITGINIQLKRGNQQNNYSMDTNIPIDTIELGYKNEQLFVQPKASHFDINANDISSLIDQFNQKGMPFDLSSFFNNENTNEQLGNLNQLFQNSFGNLDEMMKQMQSQFSTIQKTNTNNSIPKYNFINNPNINKLIIIDGKESNFKTLNTLAKNNQLDTVDNLKPATAISLYGDKAKDGAVIATTIKK